MHKVYIAGKLNDMAIEYVQNCARMIKLANAAREAGFAVFVPCVDILQGLLAGDWTYRSYFNNSQPWLRASDAMLVVEDGWRTSTGTKREMETAKKHGIPIFFNLDEMIKHFESGSDDEKND